MKWWDGKGNWVVSSLSYNLQKFIGSFLKLVSFERNILVFAYMALNAQYY